MGHGSTDCGHPISQWGKHSGLPHNEWGAGLCPQELDYNHGTNTRTGSGCVLQGFEFRQKDKIRTWLSHGKGMVQYLAQINPPPDECVTAEYHDFMVRVEMANFQLTLVHPAKEKRWRRMGTYIHITAKSCALFLYRLRQQGLRSGPLTAEWLRSWVLIAQNKNPPYRDRITATFKYLRRYAMDVAYVTPQGST